MAAEIPYVSFSFAIKVKKGYEEQRLLGTDFQNDSVPPGADPVQYLRERVLAELDRVTLRASTPATHRQTTVELPGFGPASSTEVV